LILDRRVAKAGQAACLPCFFGGFVNRSRPGFGKTLPFCRKIFNLTRPMKGVIPLVFYDLAWLAAVISLARNSRIENHQL
jgi:hypothetical protein